MQLLPLLAAALCCVAPAVDAFCCPFTPAPGQQPWKDSQPSGSVDFWITSENCQLVIDEENPCWFEKITELRMSKDLDQPMPTNVDWDSFFSRFSKNLKKIDVTVCKWIPDRTFEKLMECLPGIEIIGRKPLPEESAIRTEVFWTRLVDQDGKSVDVFCSSSEVKDPESESESECDEGMDGNNPSPCWQESSGDEEDESDSDGAITNRNMQEEADRLLAAAEQPASYWRELQSQLLAIAQSRPLIQAREEAAKKAFEAKREACELEEIMKSKFHYTSCRETRDVEWYQDSDDDDNDNEDNDDDWDLKPWIARSGQRP